MYIFLVDKLVELLGGGSVKSNQFYHPWAYLMYQKLIFLLSVTWHSGSQSHSSLSFWRQQDTSND